MNRTLPQQDDAHGEPAQSNSMRLPSSSPSLFSLFRLQGIRGLLRTRRARLMVVLIAFAYAIVSAFVGRLVQVFPAGSSVSGQVGALSRSTEWWNPVLIVNSSGWVLSLPLFATATLILVSIGVGLAMAACLVLVGSGVRKRGQAATTKGAGASIAPAVAGLATHGVCCCAACTATLGLGVVASVSGTDVYSLLRNAWYVNVFQLVVVGLSLAALERGLRLADKQCYPAIHSNARLWVGIGCRVALLVGGITWSMAMFVEWSVVSPVSASPAQWYHWILEHQLLALIAIFAALLPGDAIDLVAPAGSSRIGGLFRGGLFLAGFTWGVWVPPMLADLGLGGLLNEFFGLWGLPASWGAIPVDAGLGALLAFHLVFQHLLLSGFAMLLATRPRLALTPLAWTLGLRTLENNKSHSEVFAA